MGLARLRRRPEPLEERGYQSWWNLAGVPGLISSGAYRASSVEQTLRNAASWACIDVIADAIGRTPLHAYRGRGAGAAMVEPPPPILDDPSGLVQPDAWAYQFGFALATDGNAFGRVTSVTRRMNPATIEWLDPATVINRKVVGSTATVEVDRVVSGLWPDGDIWHVPGRVVVPGSPFGLSPVDYAARVIGTSLSAEDFSYQFFADGAHPTALIYSAKELNFEQAKAIKEAWRQATTGNREAIVLGSDLKHETVQVPLSETQFLDLQRFCVEQACRIWHVPPSMVYGSISGQSVTYANVSDADLSLLKHSLDGYFVRVETAMTSILPRPQYAKFNRNAILRSDPLARADFYTKMIATRLMTPNEGRALEDLAPITDGTGDKFFGPAAKADPMAPEPAPVAPNTQPVAVPVPANGNGKGKP